MMSKMHNPPHPGEVLRDTVLGEISVTEFASRLGVSRVALSRVINGRAAVSAEMAIRLAAALAGKRGVMAAHAGGIRLVAGVQEASSQDRSAQARGIDL
jgi:addiction module HigA family antidote